MKNQFDIAIIGAGPAGLAAAIEATSHGLSVVLLDEQPTIGGQIFRNIAEGGLTDKSILGADYLEGSTLATAFMNCDATYIPSATVWQVEGGSAVFYSKDGLAHELQCRNVILCSGAMERPFPIPGWEKAGVMSAGAAQTMLKGNGVVATDAVFAGTGPLLYLIAAQYLRAGIPIKAILDTTPHANYWHAGKHVTGMLQNIGILKKGLALLDEIKQSDTLFLKKVTALEAIGENGLSQVKYKTKGRWHSVETEHLFLHQGIIPNVNLPMSCGIIHIWDSNQLCWRADCDEFGKTNIDHLYIAGDGAGIGGAKAAIARGRLSALYIASQFGKSVGNLIKYHKNCLSKELSFRPFLDALYRPADQFRLPLDDTTLICRCEEITQGDIKGAIALGCMGPNQLKSYTRCGMGPCQGRMCGHSVTEIFAQTTKSAPDAIGYIKIRPPIKPLRLEELANLNNPPPD